MAERGKRVKIVVFDGRCVNPGDLDWQPLEALGELTVHAHTPADKTVENARGAAIVLTNKTVLDRQIISALPEMRYIGVQATGYNVVDLEAAAERGIPVTNVPAYSTAAVAQTVFAHILAHTQRVEGHGAGVRAGRWCDCPDFCYWDGPLIELEGLTLGVVGYGQIGQAVARLALAFGMRVLVSVRSRPPGVPDVTDALRAGAPLPEMGLCSLDDLFRHSDIVSLHCPLTDQTAGLVDRRRLALMRPSALLINTGRGGLVDEAALAEALNGGAIAGAGLDVLSREPPLPDNPLLQARNCVITPHLAWATQAARRRLIREVARNVQAFLEGRPINVVNGVGPAPLSDLPGQD